MHAVRLHIYEVCDQTKLVYDNRSQAVIASWGWGLGRKGCEGTHCSDGTVHVLVTGMVAELIHSSEPIRFYR